MSRSDTIRDRDPGRPSPNSGSGRLSSQFRRSAAFEVWASGEIRPLAVIAEVRLRIVIWCSKCGNSLPSPDREKRSMQTYRASRRRIFAYYGAMVLLFVPIFIGALVGQEVAFADWLLLVIFLISLLLIFAKWPVLTLDDIGLRFTYFWGERSLSWREIRSINGFEWGPFGGLVVSRSKGWPVYIPSWFKPSSDELVSVLSHQWNGLRSATEAKL